MTKYPFTQMDAFTTQRLAGNPCAVLFDTDALDEATMLAVARENNLSETAFVRCSAEADFGVRYFTCPKTPSPARPPAAWRPMWGATA